MVAAVKYNDYVEQLARGTHQWHAHTFKYAFSNVAPNAAHAVLADISQIASGGGYTGGAGGGLACDSVALTETGGIASLAIADEVFTAAAGMNPFRTVALYNDTPTTPVVDPLVCAWDYGSSLALADTEVFTIDNGASVWTLT
jgi:hypothetical protein